MLNYQMVYWDIYIGSVFLRKLAAWSNFWELAVLRSQNDQRDALGSSRMDTRKTFRPQDVCIVTKTTHIYIQQDAVMS